MLGRPSQVGTLVQVLAQLPLRSSGGQCGTGQTVHVGVTQTLKSLPVYRVRTLSLTSRSVGRSKQCGTFLSARPTYSVDSLQRQKSSLGASGSRLSGPLVSIKEVPPSLTGSKEHRLRIRGLASGPSCCLFQMS